MRIVVTGAAGFLGSVVTGRLLERGVFRGVPIRQLVLTDLVGPRESHSADPRVAVVVGDLCTVAPTLFAEPVDALIHLASAVSAEVEADSELGMHSIVDATRALLRACAEQSSSTGPAALVFSSSLAVYGSDDALPLPSVVDEATPAQPQTSYGAQKLACEYFIADATRKGHVDGRVVRLMTVVVRPGSANGAASSFLSTIVRDPLAGLPAVCPVDPSMAVAISSPVTTARGILAVAEAERGSSRGRLHGRLPVNLPALTVSVQDIIDAVQTVGGRGARELVEIRPDPAIEAIVGSWPARFATRRAESLGLSADPSAVDIVETFAFGRDDTARG